MYYPMRGANSTGSYEEIRSETNRLSTVNGAPNGYDPVRNGLIVLPFFTPVTLQAAATGMGTGTVIDISRTGVFGIHILGDSSTRTISFEASNDNNNYISVLGSNPTSSNIALSTTGNNELWQFDLRGFRYFRANLTAVTGGTSAGGGVTVLASTLAV